MRIKQLLCALLLLLVAAGCEPNPLKSKNPLAPVGTTVVCEMKQVSWDTLGTQCVTIGPNHKSETVFPDVIMGCDSNVVAVIVERTLTTEDGQNMIVYAQNEADDHDRVSGRQQNGSKVLEDIPGFSGVTIDTLYFHTGAGVASLHNSAEYKFVLKFLGFDPPPGYSAIPITVNWNIPVRVKLIKYCYERDCHTVTR